MQQSVTQAYNTVTKHQSVNPKVLAGGDDDSNKTAWAGCCRVLSPPGPVKSSSEAAPSSRRPRGFAASKHAHTNLIVEQGLISIDRSVVAALLCTIPRPRARSSTDDFTLDLQRVDIRVPGAGGLCPAHRHWRSSAAA